MLPTVGGLRDSSRLLELPTIAEDAVFHDDGDPVTNYAGIVFVATLDTTAIVDNDVFADLTILIQDGTHDGRTATDPDWRIAFS